MKKRVKSHIEDVRLEGKIGVGGTGIAGNSTWREIDVKEYEEHLKSMREAKDALPILPMDEEFLKEAGHVYSKLSDEGKRNLNYLLYGREEILKKHYEKGTQATWIVPYLKTFIKEYERIILNEQPQLVSKLPFFNNKPIGFLIILSEYNGLIIHFKKKNSNIEYVTWDKPVNDHIIDDEGQKRHLMEGTVLRNCYPKESDLLWKYAYGSEKKDYFTDDFAIRHARDQALYDIEQFK